MCYTFSMSVSKPSAREWGVSILVLLIGISWQYLSLWWIERLVDNFPRVSDVLMDRLPRIDFGIFGELWFFGLILLFAIAHFRSQPSTTPRVLRAIGLFYFVRGWFTFLFPIGAPAGAVAAAERLHVWGFETHAFFPGGHIGILTILAMSAPNKTIRRCLWAGTIVFGIGAMLAKTHYTMDSVAGILLAYAVCVWLSHRFKEGQRVQSKVF